MTIQQCNPHCIAIQEVYTRLTNVIMELVKLMQLRAVYIGYVKINV